MTLNQLKYWELRWKQYYDLLSLGETKRSNLAKEAETKRHNRAEERIATQQLVLERIKISQNQEKINQEWSKISLDQQKLFIQTTIDAYKLHQKDIELSQEERRIQLKSEELLQNATFAAANLIVQYENESTKRSIEQFNAYVNALDKGWDKTTAASVLTELASSSKTSESLKKLLQPLADKYKLDIEVSGPKTVGSTVSKFVSDNKDKVEEIGHGLTESSKALGNVILSENPHSRIYNALKEKFGPDKKAIAAAEGRGGKASTTGGTIISTGPNGISTPSTTTKSSGVIYSGNSRSDYGPGYSSATR